MSGLEQIWLHAPTQYTITEKFSVMSDASPRFGTEEGGVDQFLLRSGLQYKLGRDWTGTLGFDTVDNYNPSRNHENRLWQQLQCQRRIRGHTFTARLRVEERHFTGKDGDSIRARMMLRANQKIGTSKFSVIYFDELFLTLNTMPDGPAAGVDRNRIFGGLGYAVSRTKTIEAGYRVEYINRTDIDDEKRRQLVVTCSSQF